MKKSLGYAAGMMFMLGCAILFHADEVQATTMEESEYRMDNTVVWDSVTGKWCVKNGEEVNTNYTGVAQNENGWWYIRDGYLDWNYTGVAQNENGWWYIRDGYLDWSYTGVAQNENGWWYIRDGYLDWGYTGVAQNENGWWYIRDGYLDWDYTGVGQNENGWWYIRDGALDWNYTGLVLYDGREYPVVNGWVKHESSWIEELDVASTCSQLITVSVYNNTYANVSMFMKDGCIWEEKFAVSGRVGSGGIGKQREGDKKTPTGAYNLHIPFGIKENPGCAIEYAQVNENHYWGGKPAKYYNKLVDISKVSDYRIGSGEHIIDYGDVYNYCVAIDYNPEGIVGKGSAIFLHCSGKGATAGCVSIPEKDMIMVLKNLRNDAKIVIDYEENISKY